MDVTRADRWLWAVRLYPTRTVSAQACTAGHVEINGKQAKPSSPVRAGDRVEARVGAIRRQLEVTAVIDKRVGATVAVTCYLDHTPPPPDIENVAPVFVRDRSAGRPTKKDRRQLDRLRQQ